MGKKKSTYSTRHIVSSILMILALAWLTVSAPFVYASYKDAASAIEKKQCEQSTTDEDCNPFSNTTEEKNVSSVSTRSESLHEPPSLENNFIVLTTLYKLYSSKIYLAHHPELLSPPPEA